MKTTSRLFFGFLAAIILSTTFSSCDNDDHDFNPSLIGEWKMTKCSYFGTDGVHKSTDGRREIFMADGTQKVKYGDEWVTRTYTVEGNVLEFEYGSNNKIYYTYEIKGNTLSITFKNVAQPVLDLMGSLSYAKYTRVK